MRISTLLTPGPRYLALIALTLATPLACGGGADPEIDSNVSQAGSSVDTGGTETTNGGSGASSSKGGSGPMIIVGEDGGACEGCNADKVICGDGVLQAAGEECDDGNTDADDGCSDTCTVESGYVCPVPNVACRAAACGDGRLAGQELCDDGNVDPGDGCTETCTFERNYVCPTPGELCTKTDCGNGTVEGSEACDDGNHYLGDGCSIYCDKEPSCTPPAPCTSECGDGIKLGDEACDDGNARDGDGCSSTCELEPGWTCMEKAGGDLVIPIVYRDFKAFVDGGHVAFQWSQNDPIDRAPKEDIWVRTTLGTAADTTVDGASLLGRPVFKWYAQCDGAGCTDIVPPNGITKPADTLTAAQCNAQKNAATGTRLISTDGRNVYFCGYGDRDFNSFSQWYLDVPNVNQTVLSTLTLTKGALGVYGYDNTAFFPVDNLGFGNYAATGHNFHFTSEVRYWFQYHADKDATLTFNGDDDVWVFANGKLVVDISGTHVRMEDSVTLNATTTDIDGDLLGLVDGKIYEIVVFQAERNTNNSTYGLMLDDFELTKSSCKSMCGDGIVTLDEACDDGVNDGSYGTCNADCSRAGFCGDGHVDKADETCDDGNFKNLDGCNAACQVEKNQIGSACSARTWTARTWGSYALAMGTWRGLGLTSGRAGFSCWFVAGMLAALLDASCAGKQLGSEGGGSGGEAAQQAGGKSSGGKPGAVGAASGMTAYSAGTAGSGGAGGGLADAGEPASEGGAPPQGLDPCDAAAPEDCLEAVTGAVSDAGTPFRSSWFIVGCVDLQGHDCVNAAPCPTVPDPVQNFAQQGITTREIFPIGGLKGHRYKVTFTFNAIASAKEYDGGTRDYQGPPLLSDSQLQTTFHRDGEPHPSNYDAWRLTVLDHEGQEARHYFMNSFEAGNGFESHRTFPISYDKSIVVMGGGTIELSVHDPNCHAIVNWGAGSISDDSVFPRLIPNEPEAVALPELYPHPVSGEAVPLASLVENGMASQPFVGQLGHLTVTAVERTEELATYDFP